ncbi:alanine racemase [Francisella philomiragia]|uniref:alanine racemase n=1 Tax=Francisella philomiragia TaxID=28110 RepID=UPI001C9D8F32|nr:alanine racemase [Francisella philomiragia]MBY7734175.1 alanine racemase [Francisella philomiragia]
MRKKILVTMLGVFTGLSFATAENIEQMRDSSEKIVSVNPNFVEIDVSAYKHNLKVVKSIIGDNVKLCAVMKSDAYGHGLDNLIDATVNSPAVDCIAAVDNKEFAIISPKIQQSGREITALRIAPVTKSELIQAINNGWDIEEIIGSYEQAKIISETAQQMSEILGKKVIIKVSINIETAMGRMAFRKVEDIKKAMKLPNIKVVGVMTHFAKDYESEDIAKTATEEQLAKFDEIVSQLDLPEGTIQHVANSGAAAKYPWARRDMVRAGSLIYGEDLDDLQDPKHELRPVMKSFRSEVAIIERDIPPHSPINYDAEQYTRSDRKSTTATLRTGYNYGFPQKAYKSKMQVIIDGVKYPVIGKTSMNMLVVDITDEPKDKMVKVGDQALLVGKYGDNYISWEQFAQQNNMGTTEEVLVVGNLNEKINTTAD